MVPLLQVYSNPSPGVAAPRALLVRSTLRERREVNRETARRARQLRANERGYLVARYLDIRSIRAVAKEFQLSRTTAARILTEHGIDASRKMAEAQIAVAVKLYEQGLSSAAIGKRLGFDNHTILKELRGRGVAIRPAVGQRRKDHTGGVT